MKKIIFSILIFTSIHSAAQFSIGVGTGVTTSDIGNTDLVATDRLMSISGGLLVDYQFPASGLHLQSGVLYTGSGYGKSDLHGMSKDGNDIGTIDSHRISYVQVPAWFIYGSTSINFSLRGGIGPFLAFRTGDKLHIRGGDTFGNGTVMPAGVTAIRPLLAGAGVHISANFYHYQVAFEYQQSFNGIYENTASTGPKWRLNSFGLHLGYFFRGKSSGF